MEIRKWISNKILSLVCLVRGYHSFGQVDCFEVDENTYRQHCVVCWKEKLFKYIKFGKENIKYDNTSEKE